jgi:S1-C subfamily serine protease
MIRTAARPMCRVHVGFRADATKVRMQRDPSETGERIMETMRRSPLAALIVRLTFLMIAITPVVSFARAQMTSNVLRRVLELRVNPNTVHQGTATGFTIAVDGRQYLITAKHVVAGLGDQANIQVEQNDHWVDLPVTIFRCDDPIDIAVLIPPFQLTVNFPLPTENVTFQFGQDAYFLGFPYDLSSPGADLNGGYPLALIKKGLISGENRVDPAKKATVLLLDGYNNPGFSGGPVVVRDFKMPELAYSVIAVIAGFVPEMASVMEPKPIKSPNEASDNAKQQPWRIRKKADGTYFEYKDTDNAIALNTGIVTAFEIAPAIDLIRKHSLGPEEKDIPVVPVVK